MSDKIKVDVCNKGVRLATEEYPMVPEIGDHVLLNTYGKKTYYKVVMRIFEGQVNPKIIVDKSYYSQEPVEAGTPIVGGGLYRVTHKVGHIFPVGTVVTLISATNLKKPLFVSEADTKQHIRMDYVEYIGRG